MKPLRRALSVAFAAAFATALAGSASAADAGVATQRFYVGGSLRAGPDGAQRIYGQMYVEARLPTPRTCKLPVVMVHGASSTGTVFTGTPDGRAGWADHFARKGCPVYVVDLPGRGRSAYNPAYGPLRFPKKRATPAAGAPTWPQAKLLTQMPSVPLGSPLAADLALQRASMAVPDLADVALTQQLSRDALAALLDRIGPAVLLTHSQAGPTGWLTADARPALVKAIVAVEPGASTAIGPAPMLSAHVQKWFIAEWPLAFEPAVDAPAGLGMVDEDQPQGADLLRCRRLPEGHRLKNLQRTPVLLVRGEGSYHATREHCTAQFLKTAGVPVDYVKLEDVGLRGNGHGMMIEKNNLAVADFLFDWITKHVD